MTAKEKDDFCKVVRALNYLACEVTTDIDTMNFGSAKIKAKCVYDFTEKIAKRYDPNGNFTVEAFFAAREFFKKEEGEVAK